MSAPLFTILTPVFHPDPGPFGEMLASVIAQTEPDWELVIVFDGPGHDELAQQARALADERVTVVERQDNGGISVASNDGLEEATGTFVALVDHDDLLAPFALAACRRAIEAYPDADVLYSDEDKIDVDGRRRGPFCKPQFSPDWLRCHMYLGHLGVYRRSLVDEVGRFRKEFDGAQDHDLALRVTEVARQVVHIPRILYHWRQSETSTALDPQSKVWAYEAGVRAVQAALDRQRIPATAHLREDFSGIVHLEPALDEEPLTSIIIPTAGGSRFVRAEQFRLIDRCLESIRACTEYRRFEVVVVVDSSAPASLEAELAPIDDRIRFVRNPRPFNFSEACNLGRDRAHGEVLVFLNDDTEVVTPDWLERLVLFTCIDGVGAVGVKLVYSDGRMQHIGLVSRSGMGHRRVGVPGEEIGPFSSFTVQTNVISVTGACLAVRADRFDDVGGFTAEFPLAFNDIDLCMKLYRRGLRTVLEPLVVLVHHESSSRDPAVTEREFHLLFDRWRRLLDDDPYDSPHFRYPSLHNSEQEHPPAYFLMLKEMLGLDSSLEPRAWPTVA